MNLEIKRTLTKIGDFLLRNAVWVVLIVLNIYYIQPTKELIGKLLLIIVLEGIALGLSGLALYVYTSVEFTKKLMDGGDGELSKFEQLGASLVTAGVFIGVHLLVALSFFILQLEVL